MPDFWFFTTTTALFDSLSTALQIVIFVMLLSTRRPLAHALGFMAGLSLAYLACGLVFLWQMDEVNAWLQRWIPQLNSVPDAQYYLLQGLFGTACVIGGIYFLKRNWNRPPSKTHAQLTAVVKAVNPVTAVLFGILLSVTGFPLSLPYLGAIKKMASALGTAGTIPGIMYYNFVYIVPLLVPLVIYLLLRNRVDGIEAKLRIHSHRWGNLVNNALVVLLGLLFAADSWAYFGTGHPLLASKYF